MPFLGTTPTQGFVGANPKQSFTANGSTTVFTLTNPVASANDLEVFVGNVRQEPTAAYSAAGTTLTMTEAPDAGLNFYVINKSQAQVTTTLGANSVSTSQIIDSNITNAKLATGITASKLTGALPALDGSSLTGVGGKTEVISSSHTGASGIAAIEIDLPTDVKYRSLRLVVTSWYGSSGSDLYARFRRSGQSGFDTSANYHYIFTSTSHNSTNAERRSSNGDSKARLVWYGCGDALVEAGVFTIELFEHNSTKKTIGMTKRWGTDSSNNVTTDSGGFRFNYNEVVDKIQLYHNSGTITYGTYTLYGTLRE